MSRWIDADVVKQNINTAFWSEIGKIIDNAPSIDIVRCKECKSYDTEAYQNGYGYCSNHMSVVEDNDFCSYGERREP